MKKDNCNIITIGLKQALGTLAYIIMVSMFMNNAEAIFGKVKSFWGPVAFLLLFVVSAAITSYLVLGKSVMLYLDGAKKTAVKLFGITIAWMALMMLIIMLGFVIF